MIRVSDSVMGQNLKKIQSSLQIDLNRMKR